MSIVSVDERIVFVGLARVTDGALLASIFVDSKIASQEKQQFERQFLQACQQQRGITNPEFRSRVILEYPCQGNLFVMAGRDLSAHCLYAVGIRDAGYPERLAYACLTEVLERVHITQGDALHHLSSLSLTKPLKKPVREIMKRYQLADRDKTFEVQTKVEELKENMQDNVRRILETHHNLENLEQRTDNMSRQADQFLKQSVDLRRAIQWRNMKLKLVIGGMGVAFLLYIVAMIAG
mmetsp:Transcript_2110/g.4900  ORF Transcript_2110/g.4900 Transcript_2110/m.4900 type:complete len:237 (-) Transcript_2110:441-1151(-)|eukprot:CAMPEP_0178998988 /NCGR_PEP_ID=MMETSP0795-20121207/9806_1 /TAXON_ID=88552 /ORGANISM="Amoebophrya sp., Strain Ameob2" /LENGTH=236 /DNA_ID=CAMNT_0020691703 /DNA_START=595 /DNA_END=1305 /DNA_ORIENTATION=+